jgi:hypothetical protein
LSGAPRRTLTLPPQKARLVVLAIRRRRVVLGDRLGTRPRSIPVAIESARIVIRKRDFVTAERVVTVPAAPPPRGAPGAGRAAS